MRLVACSKCHTQFDVSGRKDKYVKCQCGELIEINEIKPVDAQVTRCGSCGAPVGPDVNNCDYCGGTIVRDRKSLGLVCPECYGRNESDSRYCTSCGVEFLPQSLPEDGEVHKCPCDATEMVVRSVSGVRIQECIECLGMWVPENHLDRLISKAVKAQEALPSSSLGMSRKHKQKSVYTTRVQYRPCPVCEALMNRKNFDNRSGIIIDICADHGVWLDADELEDIAGYITEKGMRGSVHKPTGNREVATAEALMLVKSMKTKEKQKSRAIHLTGTTKITNVGDFSLGKLLQRLLGI